MVTPTIIMPTKKICFEEYSYFFENDLNIGCWLSSVSKGYRKRLKNEDTRAFPETKNKKVRSRVKRAFTTKCFEKK